MEFPCIVCGKVKLRILSMFVIWGGSDLLICMLPWFMNRWENARCYGEFVMFVTYLRVRIEGNLMIFPELEVSNNELET